jgi:hypothetical protein
MDSALAPQLSQEFEAAFSKILPDLAQVLQSHKVSQTLELTLTSDWFDMEMAARACCFIAGVLYCPCRRLTTESKDGIEVDEETAGKLSKDIEAKLSAASDQLGPILKQATEKFEIQVGINPDNLKGQLSCKFVDGVLICS